MTRFNANDLLKFARENALTLQRDYDIAFDFDDDANERDIMMHVTSMTHELSTYYERASLLIVDHDANTITLNMHALHVIRAMCALIDYEYETSQTQHETSNVWEMFNLSGDDDVDYNSSYIQMICDLCESYAKHNA